MIMSFWVKACSHLSSISSSPLVSSIVTLYALILLYLPSHFTRIVFSPVLIITATLLLSLLRLGATQRSSQDENGKDGDRNDAAAAQTTEEQDDRSEWVEYYRSETETDSDSEPEPSLSPSFEDSFVQWDLRAPLEVIYEEDEEADEEKRGVERYEPLARYYPESDSDSSSDGDFSAAGFWDSPEISRFKWEEEDDRDGGLIEIALDGNDEKSDFNGDDKRGLDFHVEEDNLIEIDISPATNDDSPARTWGSPASRIRLT